MPINASTVSIPAPASSSFVNGEQGIGITGSPVPATPYYLSRLFLAERSGYYLFKVWTSGPATILSGLSLASLQPVAVIPANTVANLKLYLRKGVNRVDVQLSSASNSCLAAMLIYHPTEVIYRSSAQGWVYQTATPIADVDVPAATGDNLPVFSTMPNWASAVVERIAYLTDIPESETAREQPRMVRNQPRRTYEADFLRKGTQRSRLDAFLVGIGRREFLLPLWHEQYRIPAAMTAASTTTVSFPSRTLALREFQVGDKVFVNDGDPENFEVLTVQQLNYTTDVLTWASAPARSWPAGTRIIPMRRAVLADQGQLSAPVDTVARGGLRFELTEPEYRFGASWGRCSPVWHFDINRADDITFSYDRKSYRLDNSVGPVDFIDPGGRALVTMRSALILRGRSNVVSFRRFVDMAAGRAGRFYMPTRMADITPAGPTIGGVTLDAVPAGFTEFITSPQDARLIIAVVFNDGSPNVYRRISDVVRVGSVERFTLDLALPTTNMSRVERIQFMVPSRFDQDTFEFSHLVDESAAVRTSVLTRSTDIDGMPDIDCFVTSRVYPLEPVEQMRLGMQIDGGSLLDAPGEVLSMTMALDVEAGTLLEPLETYNAPAESMDLAFDVDGGTLIAPAGPLSVESTESLSLGLEITEGTLRNILLTTEMVPEALALGFVVESGTLS